MRPLDKIKTHDLVDQARQGDPHAYDRLFERLSDRLLVHIRVRVGKDLASRLDPMDVLQEIYVQVHRDFQDFQPRDASTGFIRWVFRIAEHRIASLGAHQRAQKRSPAREVAAAERFQELLASQTSPESRADRRAEQERLSHALLELAPDEREALMLRFFQERTLDEIAQALGNSEPTVRRLLARAQRKLGRILS